MQQEIRFATFNVLNLALPGLRFYDGIEPYTQELYDAKVAWLAQKFDQLDADVIGLQEVFSQDAVRDVLARTSRYRDAQHIGFEPEAGKLTPSVALITRLPLAGAASDGRLQLYVCNQCIATRRSDRHNGEYDSNRRTSTGRSCAADGNL